MKAKNTSVGDDFSEASAALYKLATFADLEKEMRRLHGFERQLDRIRSQMAKKKKSALKTKLSSKSADA